MTTVKAKSRSLSLGNHRDQKVPSSSRGVSLIEIIVGVSIISISLIGLISAYNTFLGVTFKNTKKIQAAYLLEEGVEAIRSMRDESWENISGLSTGIDYGLSFNGVVWATSTLASVDEVFYRKFEVFNVYRDVNDDIATSGTLDPGAKFFTVNVEWVQGAATTTKSISFYLADIF